MKCLKIFYVLAASFLCGDPAVSARISEGPMKNEGAALSRALYPTKIAVAPDIDGVLDEPLWGNVLKVTDFKTYSPDFGRTLSAATECYLAFDEENLFFAFRCDENVEVKSSVAGRDEILNDDLVGIHLDTFGDQQNYFSFYVNPEGIQADSRDSRAKQDYQFDALWDCESVLNEGGYTVEIRIPLKSIRFPEKNPVEMRILIRRHRVIKNEKGTFPPMNPQKGDEFITQSMPIVYEGLKQGRLLEILPAFTYSYKENAENGTMIPEENTGQISLTGKYGLTRDLVLDAAVNPDFSQVEADAGQIDANLRYQLYYPEARPFFLEGSENFATAIGPRIIHTRKIANPLFGAKLTGNVSEGHILSALYARDKYSSVADPTAEYADYGILRYKADLGAGSYVGGIFAAKELSHYGNRVAALDACLNTSAGSSLSVLGSYSYTKDEINSYRGDGHAFQVKYAERTREKLFYLEAAKISEAYDAQMGMLERTGITAFSTTYGRIFYPRSEIFLTVKPVIEFSLTHDAPSGIWEERAEFCLRNTFAKRISSVLLLAVDRETYLGKKFNTNYAVFDVESQLNKTLFLGLRGELSKAIYYCDDPYAGLRRFAGVDVTYQPLSHISLIGSLSYSDFTRDSNDRKIYDYLIVRLKATFLFSKHLFFRGIVENNTFRKTVLVDLLLSYTYNPGTVLYLGYGSMLEKSESINDRWSDSLKYREMKRGFFFKVSYLWRL